MAAAAAAAQFFRHRLRYALLILLSLNLLLTGVRQVFDLMGYVWSPIVANFLNLVFVIFALFAAAQLRFRFFVVYICWTPFWLAWNTFLICYYSNIGQLNREDARVLSWGTGGRSWWSRHTPGCRRTYNATSATVEIGQCQFLPPFYVEIIEAALHDLLTLVILCSMIIFLVNFPRKLIGEPYSSLPRRKSTTNRPHVTVEIGPTPPVINNNGSSSTHNEIINAHQTNNHTAVDTSFARSSDVSSGYLNVSYDASPAARKNLPDDVVLANGNSGGTTNRQAPPQPLQNYRRNSHKRRSSGGGGNGGGGGAGSVQRRTREKSRERGQNGTHGRHDLPSADRPTRSTSANDLPPSAAGRSRSRSNSTNGGGGRGRDTASADSVHSAVDQPIRTSSSRQSQRLSRPMQDINDLLVSTTRSTPSESTDSKSSSPKEEVRRQPIVRTYPKREPEPKGQTVDYTMEPRRIGANGRQQQQQQQQQQRPDEYADDPFRSMNPVRRSVISFDPKSDSDTLLRFHDHLARSQETILSRASTSQHHPHPHRKLLTAPDVVSFDSGLPPSHGGAGSDDDPRLSRESQNLSTSYTRHPPPPPPPFQQHQQQGRQPIIGYEPAFMMSYEPASSQDEPIYRPSFLKSGTAGQSPVKFRYHPDSNNGGRPSGKLPPLPPPIVVGVRTKESDYVAPNSLISRGDDGKFRVPNGNGNGHAGLLETVSNASSNSEHSGLAVPRISNSSLLV